MRRKTEYVMYFGDEVTDECMGQDVDGSRNKRQADKEIKEEMSGLNDDGGPHLLAVRKYLWKGDDGWWDLYEDELYWYHPQLDDEEGDGYQ